MSFHQRNTKYNAKKTEIDGILFDSKREAARYVELKEQEKLGFITNLERQVKFQLLPSQKRPDGTTERGSYYYADFCYYRNGEYVVEDVKGHDTDVYRLKRKMMLKMGYCITEIR